MNGRRKAHIQAPTPSPALAQLVGTLTSWADPAARAAADLANAVATIARLRDALERCHYQASRGRSLSGTHWVWSSPHEKAIHDVAESALQTPCRWSANA